MLLLTRITCNNNASFALLWFAACSALLVLIFRWVPPPGTALMVERKIESWVDGQPIDLQRSWRPWDEISNELKVAVIAGEDQKFAEHWGFDFSAIRAAFAHNEQGGTLRGASTLSQQVSKNLFLWSGRSWLRKGLEAWFTALIEVLWPKQRILEVYLNSAEWDEGVFGAEAALAIFGRGHAVKPHQSMQTKACQGFAPFRLAVLRAADKIEHRQQTG